MDVLGETRHPLIPDSPQDERAHTGEVAMPALVLNTALLLCGGTQVTACCTVPVRAGRLPTQLLTASMDKVATGTVRVVLKHGGVATSSY